MVGQQKKEREEIFKEGEKLQETVTEDCRKTKDQYKKRNVK